LTTFLSFPLKVSARCLLPWMTVIGEVVQRSVCSVVRAARGDVMLSDSAACGPAETAAGVLTLARFAQNARARSESVAKVGGVALRVMQLSVCVACDDMASSVVCPVVCGAAETAEMADLSAFDELLGDLGAERLFGKVSSVVVDCFVDRLVRLVGACSLVRGVRLRASAGFWGASGTMGSPTILVRGLPMLVWKMGLIE
jgi:hypothetical protein